MPLHLAEKMITQIDLLNFQRGVNWNLRSQKFLTSHIWDGMGIFF